MEFSEKQKTPRSSTVLIGSAIVCLLIGGIFGFALSSLTISNKISDLQDNISTLEKQVLDLQSTRNSSSENGTYENVTYNITYENVTYVLGENLSLSQSYEQVKSSVVVVKGLLPAYDFFGRIYGYSEVQGSGFVYNSTGQCVVITNYHVVQNAINITLTFTDGDAYVAKVIGSDPYVDLAVLSANASQDQYGALTITSSLALRVGDPVIAVGNPLGYTGSMTSGIVSALGRTVSVDWSSYPIADCIQTSAPINPGNSGGPLLNYRGEVVGITSYTATYEGVAAQGLGLAIPSSTILREIGSLITNGSYNNHPSLGVSGIDMTFGIAQAMKVNVTYGYLIAQATVGGAAEQAGLRGGSTQAQVEGTTVTVGGDIIIAINDARITNIDDLSTYLEEYTLPSQTINVTIVRNNQTLTLPVKLEARPPLA
jgi:S1-C subfamily serine protease